VQKKRKINSFILHEKDQAMSVRFSVVLSDDLNREIDRVAEEAETNKSEILRKALQLFLAAREGKQRGLKLGLVEPKSEKLQTEIIGL
jgi:predicted transcriptional regulator